VILYAAMGAAGAGVPTLHAQTAAAPFDNPRVRAALQMIRDDNAWTLGQQVSICEIAAPPFGEARRAAEFRRRLAALGLRNVRIDAEGNAIGERPGTGDGPTVVIAGHLDTVFPETTDVRTRRVGGRIYGPGIGDDCRGLAVVLAVARAFQRAGVRTNGTLIFVGNVGEEGPGNLRGVRHLYEKELKGRIDYFISVDGTGLGVTSRAVGSNRYRVTYKGPGGHSYGDFGMPSPIHALGRAISRIADLQVPSAPKTTFNVGIIRGGTSVNSIAFEASMDVDMRSESAQALSDVDARVRRVLVEALDAENARAQDAKARLALAIDTIGIRPAGTQPDTAAIVRAAQAAAGALGFTVRPGASSTDANFPIGLGLPGIAIDGGGRGDGAHSLDEWYEDGSQGWLGPQWAALIVATLVGVK
jgi:acetylornithine deacetylase/succinyl-diaminopimelate desuccinylase-like protein